MGLKKKSKPEAEQELSIEQDELIADEVEQDPLAMAQAARDEFESKYLRALADFQNFQRRAAQNERQALESGAANVVKSMIRVMEQFDLALRAIDPDKATAESVLQGVEMIRGELLGALAAHGTEAIEPVAGDEMHAEHHEAVGYLPSDEHAEGTVAQVISTGYRIGGRVLQPARVMLVAPKADAEEGEVCDVPSPEGEFDADV